LPPTGALPRAAELFVDGRRVEAAPAPGGLHLVQLRTDVGFVSRLVRDEPVPADWLVRPRTAPRPVVAMISAALGVARQAQVVQSPGTFADDWQRTRPDAGVAARAWFGAPIGVLAEITSTTARPIDGLVAAGVRTGIGALGFGVTAATVSRREGGEVREQLLAAPVVAAAGWTGGATTLDGSASFGLGPAYRHAALRAGLSPPGTPIRLRIGLEGRLAGAGYLQPDSGRTLSATELRLTAQTGVVWGMQ
jgi:hypothetical protein